MKLSSLMSKCSATLASIAAPTLERDRVAEVQTTRNTVQGVRDGATGPFRVGGCSCDTSATHSKLREEPRPTPWSCDPGRHLQECSGARA